MQKPIILIVDDDSISQTTLHTYLSPIATVKSAYDGYSALDQMSRGAPDLVILDNVMPGLTGLDVCRHLKGNEQFAAIPVIFISSIDDVRGKVAAFSAGAVDYITKPFLCEEIQSRITTHIDLYYLRRDLENRVAERTRELSQSQCRLNEAQIRIQRAEKLASLGTLASGISHEINTPVQFIGNNLEFMQVALERLSLVFEQIESPRHPVNLFETGSNSNLLLSEIKHAINESIEGVARITNIIQAVKMFAHPGTITLAPQSPARLIATAVSVSRNSWKNVADLTTDVEPDLPNVFCHGGDIDQVLLALILNAADAVETRLPNGRGQISVSARLDGQNVEFSVTDNGCGIPENIRPFIWDLFFTTKEPGKGTGQGLAICHNIIVMKHGGSIDFDSIKDNTTRFFFSLPILASATKSSS
jgi:signal transduction histidine kinase